jgi:hypothetical protein
MIDETNKEIDQNLISEIKRYKKSDLEKCEYLYK